MIHLLCLRNRLWFAVKEYAERRLCQGYDRLTDYETKKGPK